jgi:hypothetical protein
MKTKLIISTATLLIGVLSVIAIGHRRTATTTTVLQYQVHQCYSFTETDLKKAMLCYLAKLGTNVENCVDTRLSGTISRVFSDESSPGDSNIAFNFIVLERPTDQPK